MGKVRGLILALSQIRNDPRVSHLRNLTSGKFVLVSPSMKYTDFIDIVWYFFGGVQPLLLLTLGGLVILGWCWVMC